MRNYRGGANVYLRDTSNLIFIISTSYLLICESVSEAILCNQVTDCIHRNATKARCSFCINGSSNSMCYFPFSRSYHDKPDFSCEPVTDCDPKCVQGNTQCYFGRLIVRGKVEVTYNPRCICKYGFHGPFCDLKDPAGFEVVKGIQIKNTKLFPGKYTETGFVSYAYDVDTIERSYTVIQTNPSNGFSLTFSTARCNAKCKNSFSAGHLGYRLHSIQLRAPFKRFNKDDKTFLSLGDHIYGYMLNTNATMFTGDIPVINDSLNFLVDYTGNSKHSLECIGLIQLNNCGASPEKEVLYKRYSDIMITRSVQHLEDGQKISTSVPKPECADVAQQVWKLWIVNSESNHTLESMTQPILENRVDKTLLLPPFSLEIGKYKLLHEVSHVGGRGTSLNYRYCYFSVKTVPLVALVEGGSARRILRDHGLILVSRSSDPNSPPRQQDHLRTRWKCEAGGRVMDSGTLAVNKEYRISPANLTYGAKYHCTLTVWTEKYDCEGCYEVGPAFASVAVTVENKSLPENKTAPRVMPTELRCVQNCGELVIPNRVLILRVQYDPHGKSSDYRWSYFKEGGAEEPTVAIEEKLDTKSMLIVAEDKLDPGTKYTIRVSDLTTGLMAEYSFATDILLYTGNCSVLPDNGTAGIDLFSIDCSVSQTEQYRYEFYDKSEEEVVVSGDIFNGRMLGTTKTGLIRDVRLTRGHVMVYVYNDYGLSVTRNLSVSLKELVLDDVMKSRINSELRETLRMGDSLAVLGYISFIPDVLLDNEDKEPVANTLLDAFQSIAMSSDLGDVKQWTSTMANVLLSLNKPLTLALEPAKLKAVMEDIDSRAKALRDSFLRGHEASKWMSPREVRTLCRSVLNCVLAGLISKDDDYVGADEGNTDLLTLRELRKGSEFAERTLEYLKDVMSFVQSPGQPPSKIASSENKILLWAMDHDHEYSVKNMLDKDEEIPIEVSKAMISDLEGRLGSLEQLAVQVGALEENLFWWDKTQICSTLTSVSLTRQTSGHVLHKIGHVATSMKVTVRLREGSNKTLKCSGTVQSDPSAGWDALDRSVRVHRLDLEPRSIINIEFHFPPTNGSLRVKQSATLRPDYEMMVHHSMAVNKSNPRFSYFFDSTESIFLYLGVLPGPDVPANQTIEYSFHVTTSVCQLWARDGWTSQGCKISTESREEDERRVHCLCQHFSIFAALFPVPPEQIDPFRDTKLFLTVLDNPLVVYFVSSLLIAFLLLCLLMRYLDKRDERLSRVVVLGDNFPSDSHPYLLAVYTSSRLNAGSTAHVGCKLFGKLADSRAHIFGAQDRRVLCRGTDDWFVLYCPENLGEIKSIHLWHDNFGSRPDWFAVKIVVFDLANRIEYQFVIGQWLALRVDCFPEANILMAKARDVKSIKHTFLNNFILGLREGHLMLGVVLRHPRSKISRVQRISLLMVWMMVAMLSSIMFYRPLGSSSDVDSAEYSVGMRELIVSLQCVVVSVIISTIVLVLFRLSYKSVASKGENRNTPMFRGSDDGITVFYPAELRQNSKAFVNFDTSEMSEKRKNSSSLYQNFVRIVSKTMKTRLLNPVLGPHSPPAVKTRKLVYAIAWIACLSVIASCAYLVMLYGLKLGAADSKKWLSSVLMSFGEEITVAGPVRLLAMALLLSLAYKEMFEVATHKIKADETLQLRPPNDDDYLKKLLTQRCHPMYAPLSERTKEKMLTAQCEWDNWCTLGDFAVELVFVLVLHQLVFSIWSSHFQATDEVDRIVTTPLAFLSETSKVNLRDVHNTEQFEKFLKETFIAATYKLKWYDGATKLSSDGLDGKYWANGNVNKMIRQLRTVPRQCVTLVGESGLCVSRWSRATGDDDAYGEGWRTAAAGDERAPNSPWLFTPGPPATFASWQRLYARSGRTYDSGGYLTSLPTADRRKAEGVLGQLETFNWQDSLTRAAFLEFTLYNVNTDMFSQVTIIVEYLVAGETLSLSRVKTVEGKFRLNVCYLLFAAFAVYYSALLGYSVNRQGMLDYLKIFKNKCSFLVVALGFLAILIALLHYYDSSSYIKEFQQKGREEYFDFDSFKNYFRNLQTILTLLLSVAIVRVIMLIRLGRTLLSHFYTFVISWRGVVWLTIVGLLLFFVLYSIAKLIHIVLLDGFKDVAVLKASIYCENYAWKFHTLYFLGVKLITYSVLMGMFIIMFMHYAKIAKVYKPRSTDDFNFLILLCDILEKFSKRK